MAISPVSLKDKVINTSKAITTDWFSSALVPRQDLEANEVVKWIFQVHCPTITAVYLAYTIDGAVIVWLLNGGASLVANELHVEEVMIPAGVTSVNVQHTIATQNISCIVSEVRQFNSVN